MKSLILTTNTHEKLVECLNKKVFGISNAMFNKFGEEIININSDDKLFIKVKRPLPNILGPFNILKTPKIDIEFIENKGVWYRINKEYINKNLPWWVLEGFIWLIFFEFEKNNTFSISELILKKLKIYLPDYGIVREKEEIFSKLLHIKGKVLNIKNSSF